MCGWGRLGDYRPMTSNAHLAAVYVVAPDVPAGLTLNEYRRRRRRPRRLALRRLADHAQRARRRRLAAPAQ